MKLDLESKNKISYFLIYLQKNFWVLKHGLNLRKAQLCAECRMPQIVGSNI